MLEKQENLSWLEGKEVKDYEAREALEKLDTRIYRIRQSYAEWKNDEEEWIDLLAMLLQDPRASELSGLVVGMWDYERDAGDTVESIVEALVVARPKLPKLRTLFFGDIISEESEISWITQTDVSPLLSAYAELEYFGVRGGNGMRLGQIRHNSLHKLVIESGGLSREIIHEIFNSRLPALEHLEIWLGSSSYGGNTEIDDLKPLLNGSLFPRLRYLGLRDSEITNEIALAIAQSPLLERIETLDLSLGLLDDWGAEFLLNCPAIKRLKMLDLHHHYCSEEMMERLTTALGDRVNLDNRQFPDVYNDEEYRYVALSE